MTSYPPDTSTWQGLVPVGQLGAGNAELSRALSCSDLSPRKPEPASHTPASAPTPPAKPSSPLGRTGGRRLPVWGKEGPPAASPPLQAAGVLASVDAGSGRNRSSEWARSPSAPGSAARGLQSAGGALSAGQCQRLARLWAWHRSPPTSSGRCPSISPGRADEDRWPSDRLSYPAGCWKWPWEHAAHPARAEAALLCRLSVTR